MPRRRWRPTACCGCPGRAARWWSSPGVGDGVTDPIGEQLNRLDEADMLDLLQEGVGVAALPTTEAVEVPVVGPDVERRGLLVVEGAQPLQRIRAGAAKLNVFTDEILDIDLIADGGDVAIGDPAPPPRSVARHTASLEPAAGAVTQVQAAPVALR